MKHSLINFFTKGNPDKIGSNRCNLFANHRNHFQRKNGLKILAMALMMLVFFNSTSKANLLVLGAAAVDGIPAGSGNIMTFTITWNNSWMTAAPNNWDAVWIFAKYQDCTDPATWIPVIFSTAAVHTITGGVLQVDPAVSDGMGVFIRRIAIGGPANIGAAVTATLTMTTPAGGGAAYNFKVFGIEMVRITPEDFQVGDGVSASTFSNNNITAAVQAAGILGATLGGGASNVPATYPMRWDIYCMKYEITQEQYVDFLNCLTYTQQQTRTVQWPNVGPGNYVMYAGIARNRNQIVISTSGVASTTPAVYSTAYTCVPANFLSWADLTAYLDWSGLRPMTDIEFERICRGPTGRVGGEYVWGNTTATQAGSQFCIGGGSNWGTVSELPAAGRNVVYGCSGSGQCNVDNSTGYGPLRVGSLAAANPTRIGCGAAYYGVMEMGGNVWERVVSVNADGISFTGVLGNGVLDAAGDANQAFWPPPNTGAGSGRRGGDWYNAVSYSRTSDRTFAATVDVTRTCSFGGRGVR